MTVEAVALRLGSVMISRLSDANSQQCWNTVSEKRHSQSSHCRLLCHWCHNKMLNCLLALRSTPMSTKLLLDLLSCVNCSHNGFVTFSHVKYLVARRNIIV